MKPLLEFQVSELITTKTVVKEIEKLLGTYSRTGKIETLIAAQEAVHKVEKTIADAIKSATPAAAEGEELNWDTLPIKAPIFVLNLAKKYPQKEQKYYDAWKAIITKHAPAPGEKANYGKYINMFKHYARRPEYELALEDVDFDAEIAKYNDVNEENDKPTNESNTSFKRIKMFEDFEVLEAAAPKIMIVKVDRDRGQGRTSTKYVKGTLEDMIGYFGYTLEIGHSYKKSISLTPKTPKAFIKALQDSYSEKEANIYNRTSVDLVEEIPAGTPESEISDQTKRD